MTDALLKSFRASLYEIYVNALEHSETQLGIFSCGQFFPTAQRLDFTVADLGIGIRERIRRDLQKLMDPQDAIGWAMAGNTTRRGGRLRRADGRHPVAGQRAQEAEEEEVAAGRTGGAIA
jgi:hypothetical protein